MFQSTRKNLREKQIRWHTSKQENWQKGARQQKVDKIKEKDIYIPLALT
jgi:hypothetical protein